MKEVVLKEMKLRNFKKIKSFNVDFGSSMNETIYGDNGTGKSTIFDAFTWLLFGKDQYGRTDSGKGRFEVKTLDSNNNPIHKLEHIVWALFVVDGEVIELKRIYREKWVKQRGESESVMTGHETEFFWNSSPMLKKEYEAKVSEILEEPVFKMITNPYAFNELHWAKQREILIAISGGIADDKTLMQGDEVYSPLIPKISNKSLNEYLNQIKGERKSLKENLEKIPVRIDEATRAIPEPINFDDVKKEITKLEVQIADIDKAIADKSTIIVERSEKRKAIAEKISELNSKISVIESAARNSISETLNKKSEEIKSLEREIESLKSQKEGLENDIKTCESKNKRYVERQNEMKEEWKNTKKEFTFDDSDSYICPVDNLHCDRLQQFKQGDVEKKREELKSAFNLKLNQKYQSFSKEGQELSEYIKKNNEKSTEAKDSLEALSDVIEAKTEALQELKTQPAGVRTSQSILDENKEYQSLKNEKAEQEEIYNAPSEEADTYSFKNEKEGLVKQLDQEKSKLQIEKQIQAGNARVKELEEEEKEYAANMSELDKMLYLIEQFTAFKVRLYDERVNSMFTTVKFKFFELQLNGGTEETCQALVDGVPWNLANTGAQTQTGIEIINKLNEHYEVLAPIFIDKRESVTSIPETKAQVINLVVKEGVKELTLNL